MSAMDDKKGKADLQIELERLHEQIRRVEAALHTAPAGAAAWPPPGYYTPFHVLMGVLLGLVGAASSLLFNVVGASITGRHPLELIRVYLTFPLGAEALDLESGLAIGIGTCLYLTTGALYGIAFHLVLSRWFADASTGRRFLVATVLGLGLWIFNFYMVLSWLQPALFGGSWIVTLVPFWVAAATHLVFAWTMLLIEQWGQFIPYAPRAS